MRGSIIAGMLFASLWVWLVQYWRHDDIGLAFILALIGLASTVSYGYMSHRLLTVRNWTESTSWLVQLIVFASHASLFVLLLIIGTENRFVDVVPVLVLTFGAASLLYAMALNRPQDHKAIEAVQAD